MTDFWNRDQADLSWDQDRTVCLPLWHPSSIPTPALSQGLGPSLSLSSVACNVAEKKFLIVRSFMYRFMVYSSYKANKLNIFKFKK